MDGLGDYTCYCPRGFSGRFCEIAPLAVNTQFSYNSLCQSHACQNNGVCYVPKGGSHYMCQCAPGTNFSYPLLFSFIIYIHVFHRYFSLLFFYTTIYRISMLSNTIINVLSKHEKVPCYSIYLILIRQSIIYSLSNIIKIFYGEIPNYILVSLKC